MPGRQSERRSFLLATMFEPEVKIRVQGLNKSFAVRGQYFPVLEGIDFYAASGEFVSIIGPSGCGKTTLLNIIAGLEQPDTGTVELDNIPVTNRLGSAGYMQQKDLLMLWRTVLDNAILGLEIHGVSRKEARARAMDLMEAFGLKGFEKEYPYTLSGGMRQRVAFLRTVLVSKAVMLLDEPFGALDALTRAQMQGWLIDLWESLGKTIVLVTHDVDEALLLSDRVYVMSSIPGRVQREVQVDLPRPRHPNMVIETGFIQLKTDILGALRGVGPQVQQELLR